jgi:signal transduction histidine kinase
LLTGHKLAAAVVLFCLLVLGVAWGAVFLELRSKRDESIAAEVRQNVNLARALQEQTLRVLASVDQATLRMRDQVLQGRFRPQDAERFANETGLAPDILTQLSFVGPDGRFVGSNIDPTGEKTGHVDLSEREHIRAHLQPDLVRDAAGQLSRSGLFIGKPVLGKVSGKWTIQLSRAMVGADGKRLGVVVASLNPRYLEEVYGQVRLGELGIVSLIGDDLSVRARVVGGAPRGTGTLVPSGGFWSRRPLPQEGHEIRSSALDGVERIVAHRRVGDYPLQILVGTTTDAALQQWRETRTVAFVLTSLLSLAVVAVALVFLRSVRQLEAKNRVLQASEAQAQSANQAKSEFLAAISHELRTPLTSIRGFSELMEHRLDDARFREQAGLIRKAAEHLNALLTEILDLSKVEAGAMTLHPEPQDLADLLQSTVDFFAVSAADKGLQLTLRIAPGAPRALVCDGLRLKQILNNLLSNAMKFTGQGSVTLELDATPEQVRVHVVDTGPGIPPEQQALIFERFRQGHGRISYEHGGTGLGLALSRALAELMGGTLTVESSLGQGARFTLSLPRRA